MKSTYFLIKLLAYFAILCIFIISLLIDYHFKSFPPVSLSEKIIYFVANTLMLSTLPILLLTFFFELFIKQQFLNSMSNAIVKSLLMDEKLLNKFDITSKQNFLEKTIKNIVGDSYGQVVYDCLIDTFISNSATFRDEYLYDIDFSEKFDSLKELLSEFCLSYNDYIFSTNRYQYRKNFATAENKFKKGVVFFIFDGLALHKQLSDETIFFREHLYLTPETKNPIFARKKIN